MNQRLYDAVVPVIAVFIIAIAVIVFTFLLWLVPEAEAVKLRGWV